MKGYGIRRNEREEGQGEEKFSKTESILKQRSHLSTNFTPFFMSNTQNFSVALSPSACILGGFTVVVLALAHWLLALLEQHHVAAGE